MSGILCVEDDFRVAARVEEILVAGGHAVSVASTVEQALQLCAGYRFDLVIVDLFVFVDGVLSPEGGHGFIRRLRGDWEPKRSGWWATVPILAVSGGLAASYGLEDDGRAPLGRALGHGATDTLQKSQFDAELLPKVESMLPSAGQ